MDPAGMLSAGDDAAADSRSAATGPVIPIVRQTLTLNQDLVKPATGPGEGTAKPKSPPKLVRRTAKPPSAPPPAPPMARRDLVMPAVKQGDIQSAELPPAEPGGGSTGAGTVSGTDADPNAGRGTDTVATRDAAAGQRREQIEHDNVQLASLTRAPASACTLPPAPPPIPPSRAADEGQAGGPKSLIGARRQSTWLRFAALTPPTEGRGRIAIVLDDMGLSLFRSDRAIALPRPITLAILPYGNQLAGLVARARTAGHEVLLHLPMEPKAADVDPGPNALLTGLPTVELDRRIAANLGRLDSYVGVNNHMGSRFTASAREMRRVMRALKARDLLFLDSLTTGRSTGHRLAREFGIPSVVRDIFIDNDRNPAIIRRQLALAVARARSHCHAITIGHPYPETLNALESWLPTLAAQVLVLIPVSSLVSTGLADNGGLKGKQEAGTQARSRDHARDQLGLAKTAP